MPDLPQIGPPSGLETPGTFTVPQENPAVRGMQESAARVDQMVDTVTAGIRRFQVSAQANAGDSDMMSGTSTIENKTLNDPVQMQKYFNLPSYDEALKAATNDVTGQIDQLRQGILAKNKPIALELNPQLLIRSSEGIRRFQNSFRVAYDQNLRAQFEGPEMAATAQAVADAGPDTPDGQHKAASYLDLLNKIPGLYDNERHNIALQFNNLVRETQARGIALTNPAALPDFLSKHPDMPAEQQLAVMTMATETMNRPLRQIEANRNMVRSQALQTFDQQMQAGHVDMAALTQARQDRYITEEDYEYYAHVKFLEPTHPAILQSVKDSITGADTPEELDQAKADIRTASVTGVINGADVPQLNAAIEKRKIYITTTQGRAEKAGKNAIADSLLGIDKKMYGQFAGTMGVPTLEDLEAKMQRDFAYKIIGVTDPNKIWQAAQEVIKANRPDPKVTKLLGYKPKPATDDERLRAAHDILSGRVKLPTSITGPGPESAPAPAPAGGGGGG